VNAVSATDYKVEVLNADNGFNSSIIFSIVQDEQGFLWFGSGYQGLFRYDGKNIKRFKHEPNNVNSLPHNNTGNLIIDSHKNLWIGSFGGSAIKYNLSSGAFSQYRHNPLLSNTVSDARVQNIFQDKQGNYWMGTFQHGLNKFNPKDSSFIRFPFGVDTGDGTSNERIWDITQTGKNDLWLATSYGLNHLDKATGKFSYYIPEPGNVLRSSNKIRKILAIDNNRLILTTDEGVLIFNIPLQTFTPINELTNTSIGETYSVIKTSFNQYWVASASGVYAFSLEKLILEKVNLDIYDDCSQTLFEDRDGLIWLTCEGIGVYKITPNKHFKIKSSPYFRTVRNMSLASDNSIYLTSATQGIREWFPHTNTLTTPFPKTDNLRIDSLLHSKEGEKWIKGTENLYSIDKAGNIEPIVFPPRLQRLALEKDFITFNSLKKDKYSRLWFGTGKGLFIIDKRENELLHYGNGTANTKAFQHQGIIHIYRDNEDRMWVTTKDGLYLWNELEKNFTRFSFDKNNNESVPLENIITRIYQDRRKRIWVGSQNGLFLLDEKTGKISPSVVNPDLANKNIKAIIEDNASNLWLLTDVGLSLFSPETKEFQNFDQRDGLSNSRSYDQLIKISDGTIFFTSREGLHFFNPEQVKNLVKKQLKNQALTANTVLTNFEVLGSPNDKKIYTPNSSEFTLAYDENYLKFEFLTIVHVNSRQVNYFYKLEGFDEDWIDNGNNNAAIYTNLDGGEYTFKVRSTYRKNKWYDKELAIKINIATPFWLTWWMYVLYLCTIILFIQQFMKRKAIAQQQIIEQQNRFVIELEHQVAEKTASIAEESNKLLEANKIKSQFLANISHEIRTPLNAIIGLSHIAMQNEVNKMQADKLHKIKDSSETLLCLINDVLDLSKIEAEKLTLEYLPFNLSLLIKKTINICSFNAYEKGLELIVDVADDVEKELIGDQLRLQQILLNLMNNAIKFTDKGLIYLSVDCLSYNSKQTTLQFSITDTGIGMDLSQHCHLFEAFSQADNSITKKYGGTGLGLTISKQLIELMNGEISVRSELNKGSVFTFTATFNIAEQGSSKHIAPQSLLSNSLKILIIDENDIVRNIIIRSLNQVGISPDSASNSQDALEQIILAEEEKTPYDLVLLDMSVFKLESCGSSLKVKQHIMTSLPYIVMDTSFNMDKYININSDANFKGFVEKPIISSTFIESLSDLLSNKEQQNSLQTNLVNKTTIPQLNDYCVLLVEDNMLNQQVAKAFLDDTKIQIDCAENGKVAIDKIKNKTYDIILMDIQMPEMDGLTATSIIKNDLGLTDLPIIAMTAHAMEEDLQKSLALGMKEHLTKPISQDILYEILVKYLKPLKN